RRLAGAGHRRLRRQLAAVVALAAWHVLLSLPACRAVPGAACGLLPHLAVAAPRAQMAPHGRDLHRTGVRVLRLLLHPDSRLARTRLVRCCALLAAHLGISRSLASG